MRRRIVAVFVLLLGAAWSGCGDDPQPASDPGSSEVAGSVEEAKKPERRVYGYAYKTELMSAAMKKDVERGLLTDVAVSFAYVDSGGNLTNFDPQSATLKQFVEFAHAKGVSAHLAVAIFKVSTFAAVFEKYSQKAMNAIVKAVEDANLDAASLDFEMVPGKYKDAYATFAEKIAVALHGKGRKLYLAVSQRPGSGEDAVRLSNAADGLFIMGYAYAGSWSTFASPNAPYSTGAVWSRSYETDVFSTTNGKSWLSQGTKPEKLILGVPFYGHKFQTTGFGIKAKKVSGSSVPAVTLPTAAANYGKKWDAASKTPYWEWSSGGAFYQAWYEDAESMAIKFQAAKAADLGGIGMWKLPWGTEPVWTEIQKYRE